MSGAGPGGQDVGHRHIEDRRPATCVAPAEQGGADAHGGGDPRGQVGDGERRHGGRPALGGEGAGPGLVVDVVPGQLARGPAGRNPEMEQ